MRIILLDLIRIIAIILILIAHIGQTIENRIGGFFGIQNLYFVSIGGLGVTFFIILSGLVLELKYKSKKNSYCYFIFKRCLRIYPVYYMTLFFGIIIYIIRNYYGSNSANSLFSAFHFHDLILCLTGFYAFIGQWGGPFVGTSWFIGLIITMYLLFPFLSRSFKKNPHISIVALFFISFLSRIILGKYSILPCRPLDWFPLCRVFEYGLGIYFSNVLPTRVWYFMNNPKINTNLFRFVSEISFPLFLIHNPLIFIIKYLSRFGFNLFMSIIVFLSISILFSWLVLILDNHFPRNLILRELLRDKRIDKNEQVYFRSQRKE